MNFKKFFNKLLIFLFIISIFIIPKTCLAYTNKVILGGQNLGIEVNSNGVLVVGYDTTSRVPYYVVKNSWGSNWGENGFVRLAITDSYAGMCGIHLMGSYPFLDL